MSHKSPNQRKYEKTDHLGHIRKRPDTYVGSIKPQTLLNHCVADLEADKPTLTTRDIVYIPAMLNKIKKDNSTCVCGSKMYNKRKALKAKMPLYKLIGNIVLTKIFNFVFKTKFSDCHTGLWLYNLTKLNKNINFKKISNGYNFDNQLRIELVKKKLSISEIPIIAAYGDERSSVHLFYAIKFLFETIYRKYFN